MEGIKEIVTKLAPVILFSVFAGITKTMLRKEITFYDAIRNIILATFVGTVAGLVLDHYAVDTALTIALACLCALSSEKVLEVIERNILEKIREKISNQ